MAPRHRLVVVILSFVVASVVGLSHGYPSPEIPDRSVSLFSGCAPSTSGTIITVLAKPRHRPQEELSSAVAMQTWPKLVRSIFLLAVLLPLVITISRVPNCCSELVMGLQLVDPSKSGAAPEKTGD